MTSIAAAVHARAVRAPAWTLTALTVAGLLVLQIAAIRSGYALRVTSDTPTFLALVHDLGVHPLTGQSPYLATGGVRSPHATPYMQALASLWRAVAPAGEAADPLAIGRFLGLAGLVVGLGLLAAVGAWTRAVAGRRAAWAVVPVLLLLLGPAHVIWASDLSFHGFLYAAFYPQNVAMALALWALLILRRGSIASLAGAAALCAGTLLVHPFTGLLLAGLITIQAIADALRADARWWRGPAVVAAGYLAGLAWPAYSLDVALRESGLPGWALVTLCLLAPGAALVAAPRLPAAARLRERLAAAGQALSSARAELWLAAGGAAIVAGLAAWQVVLMAGPWPDPLVRANRLALYWGEDRWRWPLMLAAGAIGLTGLVRLARRGQPLPLVWFGGCFALAVAGALGAPVPVWWRLLLLCQVPLAAGTALAICHGRSRAARAIAIATLALVAAFKLATLVAPDPRITYWGTPLQNAYRLGELIPPGPGIVASDPFTSYYVPAATGHRVLTVTKAHVGSQAALDASARGYALLHRFQAAAGDAWWSAAEAMWRRGVRYVVIEKWTTLTPPDLETFSTGPTPLVRTRRQAAVLSREHYRLRRVGRLIANTDEYAVYRLDARALAGRRG